jgi:hypothetical protein
MKTSPSVPMRLLLPLLLAVSLAGCATVFNHAAQPVALSPDFSGDAKVDRVRVLITSGLGTYQAALPTQFTVTPDTWTHVTVKVVEPCFKPSEVGLPRHMTGWMFGDVLALGITAGASGVFSILGDGLDGTLWTYGAEAKIPVEPVADYGSCMAASRKNPGQPFAATRDPVWQDPKGMTEAMASTAPAAPLPAPVSQPAPAAMPAPAAPIAPAGAPMAPAGAPMSPTAAPMAPAAAPAAMPAPAPARPAPTFDASQAPG